MASSLDLESQLTFGDAEGLAWWLQVHANQHAKYVAKLTNTYQATAPGVQLLDQVALVDWVKAMAEGPQGRMTEALRNWLLDHERLHAAELKSIGGPTETGLSTVDFRDPQQFYGWMFDHIQLHDAEDPILT